MRDLFLQRGDQRLFVYVHGDGPAFLFAHGLFGTHADASWLMERANGFTLVAPDLRGRGASRPSTAVEEHTFEAHAADLLAILDHFKIRQAILGGSSFGAAVAIAFTLRHLERVQALILIASAFGAERDSMGEGRLEAYGELAERIAAEGLKEVAASEAKRTSSDRPMTRWTQHDEVSLIAWLRAVPMYRPFKQVSDLHKAAVPALVVSGEDAIHTRELSRAYAEALPSATLVDAGSVEGALADFLSFTARRREL